MFSQDRSSSRGPNRDGCICDDDGFGYWVKDGLKSFDDVFSTEQLDATHVVWYNK
jgi:hypothetical protein